MIFAQLQTVPGEEIKNFALIVLAILGGAYYARGIFQRTQKREVSFSEEVARKEDVDEKFRHNTTQHSVLFRHIERIDDEIKTSIGELGQRSARLEASSEIQNQTLAGMNADIKRILGRLPRSHNEPDI